MIPSSGQKGLSRLDSFSSRLPFWISGSIGVGASSTTSSAVLSSRSPWYTGARRCLSCVHSTNSTCATRFGSTQTTSALRTFGIFGTSRKGGVARSSGLSIFSNLSISASLKPVPTFPA